MIDLWDRLDRDWKDAYRAFNTPGISVSLKGELLGRMKSIAARQRDIEIELERAANETTGEIPCR